MTDKYSIYGAMDRACIEAQQVGMWLLEDEYIMSDSTASILAQQAHDILLKLYQHLGGILFEHIDPGLGDKHLC